VALAGDDASFAGRIAAVTPCPVVAALEPSHNSPHSTHSDGGDNGVCWAAGGPIEAALVAAQMLAQKYPDVWAALKRWRLEQEITGASTRTGTPSTLI